MAKIKDKRLKTKEQRQKNKEQREKIEDNSGITFTIYF